MLVPLLCFATVYLTLTHTVFFFFSHSYLFPNQEDTYWREKKKTWFYRGANIHTHIIWVFFWKKNIDFSLRAHVTCCVKVKSKATTFILCFLHDFMFLWLIEPEINSAFHIFHPFFLLFYDCSNGKKGWSKRMNNENLTDFK